MHPRYNASMRWVVVLIVLSGCPSRAPHASGDGGGLPSCLTHHLVVTPLASASLLDGPTPYGNLVVRVAVDVPVRAGCDVLGRLDVEFQVGDATDWITVTAHVWHGTSCDDRPPTNVRRVFLVAKDNPFVLVRDGVADMVLLMWQDDLPAEAPAFCFDPAVPKVPLGQPCDFDCECDDLMRAHCVRATGKGTCEITCSEDVDCPISCNDLHVCDDDTHCDACPFGQACDSLGRCRPVATLADTPCACDADCAAGQLCNDATVCVDPCVADNDCPTGTLCKREGATPSQCRPF